MSRKFLTHIDLAKNELQNAVVQNLAAAPSSPVKGQLYFDTSTNTLYWWNGTAWIAASPGTGFPGYGSVTQEQTFGATKSDGVATTVPRSDHTHGNPVHDNAAHTTIPLSTFAVPTANVSMNSWFLTNVGGPVSATDAATKGYVDNAVAGLSWKDPVRCCSSTQRALTGLTAIDGVTPGVGDRVLLKGQTAPAENGIWTASGASWTRATDAETEAEVLGAAVFVSEGTTLGNTGWVMTTDAPITVGTTGLTWVQFLGGAAVSAGAGLVQNGNAFDVGAGTGILVAADTVAVDTGTIATVASVTGKADKTTTVTAGAGLAGGGDLSANRTLDVGAGTGITVAADTVALDTTYTDGRYALAASGAKRYAVDVGSATSQVVTHNLNTLDVIVQVYRKAGPNDQVECDVEHTSVNTVTLRFTVAPSAAEYRAVVMA